MEYVSNNRVIRHNFKVDSWLDGGSRSTLIFKHAYLKKVYNTIQIVDENLSGYYYDAVKVKIILKNVNNEVDPKYLEIIDSLDNLYDFSEMLNYLEFSVFYLVNHCGISDFNSIIETQINEKQYKNFENLIQDLDDYLFENKSFKHIYNDNNFRNFLFKIIIYVRYFLKEIYNNDLSSVDDYVKFCNYIEYFFINCNKEMQVLLMETGLNV